MNGNYGVTRDIYAKMKVAGFVMWKLVAIFSDRIFHNEQDFSQ